MALGGCTSDPTSGCGEGASTIAEIRTGNERIVEKLTELNNKATELKTQAEECCEETNDNLTDIKDRLDTLISNSTDCCEAITDRLDILIGVLQSVVILPNVTQFITAYSNHVCIQDEQL